MAGLTIKVLLYVEAKKHIFLHCNASNLVLKILQHDKIWRGGGTIPPLQILGWTCPSVPCDLRPCVSISILFVVGLTVTDCKIAYNWVKMKPASHGARGR